MYCKSVQQLQCSNKRTLTDKSSTEDLKVNCCKGRGQIWRCDTTTIWRDFFLPWAYAFFVTQGQNSRNLVKTGKKMSQSQIFVFSVKTIWLLENFVKIGQVEIPFFIAASSDSFKNIVKTHGGILVKENVTKSNNGTKQHNPPNLKFKSKFRKILMWEKKFAKLSR